MRQVWHLFRNDLRAAKYILAVWVAALAAYVATAWQDPLAVETDLHASAIGPLTNIVAAVVVAILIQQDSLVGARSFWMTRPVGRWSLLGAKALFIGVAVVGAQLVACTALLLRFGMSTAELPSLLIRISSEWVWLLAAAVVLATVTSGAAQFITAGLVAYGATIWAFVNVGLLLKGVRYDYDYEFLSEAALGACCALIVLRYAGLSRWKTTGAFVGCWACLILLPLTGWEPAKMTRQPVAAPLNGVTLRAVPLNSRDGAFQASGDKFVVRWEADGLDANQFLHLEDLEGKVIWDDGEATAVEDWDNEDLGSVRGEGSASALDFGAIHDRPIGLVNFRKLADPESIYGKRGVLRARVTGRLQRIEEYGTSPVVTGATLESNGYAVRLESVLANSGRVVIRLRENRVVTGDEGADWPRPVIFRRDIPARLLEAGVELIGSKTQGWGMGWPVIAATEREFVYRWARQRQGIVNPGPGWIERAEMTLVGYAPERRVTLEVEVPDLCVAAPFGRFGPGLPGLQCEALRNPKSDRARP